jgi:SAM-dependent methyltransferase
VPLPRPRRLREDHDTWQRHAIVARLLGPDARRVLDAGGVPGRLAAHLPGVEVVTANPTPPADVVYDGARLPFADGAFDAVTSLDVLEHIPRAERPPHVAEVLRVARALAVLCCPLGTPEHVAAEREMAEWYAELAGEPHPFLDEHVARGLPTESELHELAAGHNASLAFHGDFRATMAVFRAEALAAYRGRPADRARFAWRRLTAPRDLGLRERAGPYANRAFVVVKR